MSNARVASLLPLLCLLEANLKREQNDQNNNCEIGCEAMGRYWHTAPFWNNSRASSFLLPKREKDFSFFSPFSMNSMAAT
jgi:hypothetical protein